ncbi:unnamed protein product [Ectocarpus sp. CCAP 1310/34]|nr:unnamed protein product [Ectocarpus sp. CCAP 1310/34]
MASASEVELSQAHEQLRRKTVKHRVGQLEAVGEDQGVDIGGVKDVAIDFLAGVVSGISGIVVGQPFDTIKVRLQTQDLPAIAPNQPQPQAKGAMACAVETVSKEGVLALFKGMSTPLASAALVNAICFGAYAQSQRVEERRRNAELLWSFVGGSFAGLCQAVIIIPTDIIKIKLQIQVGAPGSSNLKYRGPVDCAMSIFNTQGVRGLFRGSPATAIRDTPAMGLYFASYEAVKDRLESRWGFGEQASSFWAGGLAGALSWFVSYPFDVVKSVQQAAADPMDPNTRSMTACFRHVYNTAGGGIPGVSRFFRGVSTTVVRAVPVNAAIFPTFEWTVKVLNKAFPSSS